MTEITRHRVRLAAFWVGALLLVEKLSEIIRASFLARWFSRDEMGMVAILLMLQLGIRVLTETGHYAALVQRTDDQLDEAIDTSFVTSAIRGVVLTLLLMAVAGPVATFYREPRLAGLIMVSGIVFFLDGLESKHMLRFNRRVEMHKPKLIEAGATAVNLAITIGVAIAFDTIWCVVFGSLGSRLVRVVLTHVVAERRTRLRFSKPIFWELFRYGRNIWGTAVLVFLVTQMDDAVVGRVLDLDRLSLYALAYMLANLPITSIVGVATQVAFPTWSAVVRQGDMEKRDRMFLGTVRFTGALSIALSIAMLVSGADLLETIFGAKWRDANEALSVLIWFGLIRGVSSNFGTLFNSLGRPHLVLREIAIKVVVIVVSIYPMTVAWGIRGAALAVTLPMVLITPIAAHIYLRIAGISGRAAIATLIRPALGAALVIAARHLVDDAAWHVALPVPVRAVGWIVVAAIGVLGLTWVADASFRDSIRLRGEARA